MSEKLRKKHFIQNVRMHLKTGKLAEDLCPMSHLERLVHTCPDLSMGCSPLKDYSCYYSNVKVSILKLDQELIYGVAIPFISNKKLIDHKFKSFHIPSDMYKTM